MLMQFILSQKILQVINQRKQVCMVLLTLTVIRLAILILQVSTAFLKGWREYLKMLTAKPGMDISTLKGKQFSRLNMKQPAVLAMVGH